jgi:hypothetical protein
MHERHVTEAEVMAVLVARDVEYQDRAGNAIYVARVGARRIKVVVKAGSLPPRVITVGD